MFVQITAIKGLKGVLLLQPSINTGGYRLWITGAKNIYILKNRGV